MKIPGYKAHRVIGKGGMATVFLATQTSFERKVALKVIADKAFGGKSLAERFIDEAKIVGSFSHPYIVPVYDVGQIEQFHYIAMDYLKGGDLSSWIKSGLSGEEAEQIIVQIAQALHFAHNKGYIHRDIKPDNILFREDNSAVLTDFGIAQPLNLEGTPETSTVIVGTPAYMSPEQAQGKELDNRSDLYAMGVMFYQMLTRQLPYSGKNSNDILKQQIQAPIPKLPFQLQRYQSIIDRLLAKSPQDRFQSALEFSKALENLADNPNINKINESISELRIVDTEEKPVIPAETALKIEESSYRKLGVSKRFKFSCTIHSDEPQHFSLLFNQFTTRLIEWHNSHGKQCAEVICECYIEAIMKEMVEKKFRQLFEEENFDFLNKIKTRVELKDLSGKPL